jgi:hypothetical protein
MANLVQVYMRLPSPSTVSRVGRKPDLSHITGIYRYRFQGRV